MKPTVVSLRPSSRRHLLARWSALGLALLLTGYGWYRTAAFDAPTGPHRVAWRGPDDRPIKSRDERGDAIDWWPTHSMTLGERLIVLESGARGRPRGFSWISPRLGQAKLAWPLSLEGAGEVIIGLAARDAETFAALEVSEGKVYVGIAGPQGWKVAPTPVLSWDRAVHNGYSILLGMGWIQGELEIVLTRPAPDDPFGTRHPFEVVRLPERGVPVVTRRPISCELCSLQAALPTERGWRIVALSYEGRDPSVLLFDERDQPVVPVPPGLSWWSERRGTDATRLGSLWRGFGEPYQAMKDGSRQLAPAPPRPGLTPNGLWRRFTLVDGELHSRPWYQRGDWFEVIADRVGAVADHPRVIFSGASPSYDAELVGPSPEELRPVVRKQGDTRFLHGAFLPRPGGYFWVTAGGAYVALDEQLRRVDPLPLLQHLRTRGSAGDHIDEWHHVAVLGWVMLGLPLCLAFGALSGWRARRRVALPAASVQTRSAWSWRALLDGAFRPSLFYLATSALALYKILPLL